MYCLHYSTKSTRLVSNKLILLASKSVRSPNGWVTAISIHTAATAYIGDDISVCKYYLPFKNNQLFLLCIVPLAVKIGIIILIFVDRFNRLQKRISSFLSMFFVC